MAIGKTAAEKQDDLTRDGFATISEGCDFLKLSRSGLYGLMETGQLTFARFGRARRIPWRALWAFAQKHMAQV
jgi:excisionase family DNA binding protein